jgi:hypothetical protein
MVVQVAAVRVRIDHYTRGTLEAHAIQFANKGAAQRTG